MVKLKIIAIAGIICFIIGFLYTNDLTYFLISMMPEGVEYVALNPADGFMLLMWVGLIITLNLFFLIFGIWVYWFMKDAMYEIEKKIFLKLIMPVSILFIIGSTFGMYLYLYVMLPFFIQTNNNIGLTNLWSLSKVIISGIKMSLILGLTFEFPIILRNLITFGFVKIKDLKKSRMFVGLGILIASAIITPTPDILSMFILALPLYGLFELSMLKVKVINPKIGVVD